MTHRFRTFLLSTLATGLLASCATPQPSPLAEPLVTPMPSAAIDASRPLTRIAFGSCLKEEDELSILSDIVAADPDLFLLIGDNIYSNPH